MAADFAVVLAGLVAAGFVAGAFAAAGFVAGAAALAATGFADAAFVAVALAAGASMEEAAIVANHAAGLVIREVGTASVGLDAIERSFSDAGEGERVG